ncbi:MFS transporter [Thiohalorhabdus denitrificans]|uniref:Major Facilitator Superfamily protein n=1 Tax=Thiohalorhabdus denitrificans TaxID=381306 RepID=A0A0P9C8C1_9GAMM|nr:MFS transporter [Thiohalorhabdus denitrificans]KPV41506.1 MFS transporter [Thiohalorhabdus denitrificans]SCY29810.1 Major Facilitator Superfamily protein [Thiohalorhabdus denitrificans]
MEYLRFVRANGRFLGFGLLAVALSGFGQTYFISLFGGEIRAAFDLGHGAFGGVYSAATLASGVLLLWAGQQLDRLDLRLVAALVVVGVAAGSLLMAAAGGVLALAAAMFLLRFAGQGLMTHMAFTSMGRYFEAGRGKAVSIAGMGMPLGEALLPAAAVSVTAVLGWRGAWTAAAVFLVGVALPLLLGLLRGHGARRRELSARESAHPEREGDGRGQWTRAEVLRDPRFYLLLPAVLAAPLIATALFFHQVHLADAKGWALSWLASSFPAFAATHVLGLLVSGPLVDRVGARRLLPVFLLPMAAGLAVLAAFDQAAVAPVYLALMGASMGATGTLLGALWPELYGVAHLGAIRAVVQSAMVLSTAIAPAAAGLLIDWGLPMEALALLLDLYIAGAITLVLVALRLRPAGAHAGS